MVLNFQKISCDSFVMYQLDIEDPDVLIVTYNCHLNESEEHIVARRKFRRFKEEQLRKISVI